VRHPDRPGQYLLAVECDGAAYHAALWARERDRLRQDVLENLGWRFHRIWSTDWFHHRSREIQRLSTALNEARLAVQDGIRVRGANGGAVKPAPVAQDVPPELVEIDHLALSAPPYVRAELSVRSNLEPHEAPVAQLADLVVKIVEIEGPIHIDEVARRITSAFGRSRAGNRIVEATGRAARLAAQRDRIVRREGPFLLTEEQAEDPPIRDRIAETGSLLKASYLPPMEIVAAAHRIRSESGDMSGEDMTRAIARLLGFQRVGSDLAEVINDALQLD
jgi:hypothetical protein